MADRDEKTGRFVTGNKAGKGRPPKEYAEAFSRVVSVEDWERIIRRALDNALEVGGQGERAWLADRLIGKVPVLLDLPTAEIAQLSELVKAAKSRGVELGTLLEALLEEITEESDFADE